MNTLLSLYMNDFKINIICCISMILLSCSTKQNTSDSDALKNHLPTSLVNNPRSIADDSLALHELGRLIFNDTIHDFGKMQEGEKVEFDFEFTNKGKKDIVIGDARASCGCTVASFPEKPVKFMEQNTIKVTFNSEGKKGYNEKMVVVTTNGNPSVYNLYIRAEVTDK